MLFVVLFLRLCGCHLTRGLLFVVRGFVVRWRVVRDGVHVWISVMDRCVDDCDSGWMVDVDDLPVDRDCPWWRFERTRVSGGWGELV